MNDNENKTNAPTIEPCPFCGGEAVLGENVQGWHYFYVECEQCDYCLDMPTRDGAIENWNKRAALNEADALRSILADALVVIERSKGITESRADYDDLCTVRNRINAAIKPNAAAGEQKP